MTEWRGWILLAWARAAWAKSPFRDASVQLRIDVEHDKSRWFNEPAAL